VPTALDNIVCVSCGLANTTVLTADGEIVYRGGSFTGQQWVPRGLGDVVAISSSGYHSMALTADGRLVGWGLRDHGQCDTPDHVSIRGQMTILM
jgi:alpha-tubulin suppressor-like RCC1 family protein